VGKGETGAYGGTDSGGKSGLKGRCEGKEAVSTKREKGKRDAGVEGDSRKAGGPLGCDQRRTCADSTIEGSMQCLGVGGSKGGGGGGGGGGSLKTTGKNE